MILRSTIVAEARTWLGVPWKHQGRVRTGVDCGGLVLLVTRAVGQPMEDVPFNYRRRPNGHDFTRYFFDTFDRVSPESVMDGDVVLMRDDVLPCHCGFATTFQGRRGIIHASAKHRRVVEHSWGEDVDRLLTHTFRFRGVIDG